MNNYKKNTAGSLMVNNVPIVDKNISVNEVEEKLIKDINNFSTINYIYIVNKQKKLIKVISIKELFRSDKNIIVKNLPSLKLITVPTNTDKEKVVLLALKHSLKAVPVVSKENIFLGVVPSDTILQILQDKSTEKLLRLSGVTLNPPYKNKVFSLSLLNSLKHRLPWLIFGLLGGFIMAWTVGFFEDFLSQNIILAAFIPLILYMSNAVGAQTQSFIIRDLALEPKLNFVKYLRKQLVVVMIMGLFISLILYVISFLMHDLSVISLILSIALFLAILSSLLTGLIFPFFFNYLKLDPADASGPIASIIQDILSIFIYFLIASLIL